MLYPLTFRPIFKDRVWGGRKIADLYGKPLPPNVPIGESWEVSDRPGDVSVILNGPLAGKELRWLMQHEAQSLFGRNAARLPTVFPLLIKILDAREKLSLQVHPPASKARELGGEPKTEMWHIADADPGAELYVGLKRGVTRMQFEERIRSGGVSECFHRVPVRKGDTMFLPSGRVHAIGAGLVIFEIQQNSDSTYRVYDWDRVGLDGKPRELHIQESLASIDFEDFEPQLVRAVPRQEGALEVKSLVSDPLFVVEACRLPVSTGWSPASGQMQLLGVLSGELRITWASSEIPLSAGQFCLLPAERETATIEARAETEFLRVQAGNGA